MGTGKSTDITITSSTNLSEDEINKAVKDAEQYAEDDKKRKEKVEAKNKLDGMIFSVEQTLKEADDKLSDEDKETMKSAIEEAKKALDEDDEEKYRTAFDELSKKIQPVVAKLYSQGAAGANGEPHQEGGDEEFHQ